MNNLIRNTKEMPRLKIFVVFHKKLFSSLYKGLKRHRNDVVFVGVKHRIPKVLQRVHRYNIIYESDFKNYNPKLQARGYRETSVLYHVYINKLYADLDYIGFAQYDMAVNDDVFKVMIHNINTHNRKKHIFYTLKLPVDNEWGGLFISKIPYDHMINSYNRYFHTNFTADEIRNNKAISENLILLSTFIIPVGMFEKIMGWISVLIDEIYPWANLPPYPKHSGHLGGITERAYGLALAIELLNHDIDLVKVPIIDTPDKKVCDKNKSEQKRGLIMVKKVLKFILRPFYRIYQLAVALINGIKQFINNTVNSLILWLADLVTIERPRYLLGPKLVLLKLIGVKLRGRVFIDRGFRCFIPHNILIEKNVSMGHDNHIWAFYPVKIGRFTQTAKDLLIISGSHDVSSFGGLANQEVDIGAGCWIGARVTILGGSKIGKGCVVGACSMVKGEFPDWSIIAGTPARIIGLRTPADKIISPFAEYSPKDL